MLKHKVPSAASLRPAPANTAGRSKPRSASVTSHASVDVSSSNYLSGRHERGSSSSSGVQVARKVRGSTTKPSSDLRMEIEEQTIVTSQRSSQGKTDVNSNATAKMTSTGSRTNMHPFVNGMEVDEAGLLAAQGLQEDVYPLPSQTDTLVSTYTGVDDEDMSEAESDWPSSSAEGSSRRHSSKTETEDLEDEDDDFGIKAGVVSSDEDIRGVNVLGQDEDEEDEDEDSDLASGEESVILNDLDPECFVSLPPEVEDLAQAKVAQICAKYEELIIRPAMVKQALERQTAVQRGELAPEVAAHDDELALMGLDPDEVRDTSMVAEYSKEIFEYMSRCEVRTMANPNYMDFQGEIRW